MPEYVHGVELTQAGMHAIFERMGQDITSGIIYNGNPDVRVDKLDQQGFMPILTGVNPT
ncbi:Dot/Icm substrate SidE, partial [Legionella gratiana]